MIPATIPDPKKAATLITGKGNVRLVLFRCSSGFYVVKYEKGRDKSVLGYFRDVKENIPELIRAQFKAAIDEYNNLTLEPLS